jgi:hypothetical protein
LPWFGKNLNGLPRGHVSSNGYLAGQESPPRTNLQPQFFLEGFAALELFEKLFQNAHHYGVNADAFLFSPFPEGGPSLSSNVKQLRRTERQTRLTGLLDFYIFAINVAQSEKDDPGQIALDASLFGDRFSQFEGESESHSGPIVRPPLAFAIHFPDFLLFGQPLFPFKDYALFIP